jgi:hypothetical protein
MPLKLVRMGTRKGMPIGTNLSERLGFPVGAGEADEAGKGLLLTHPANALPRLLVFRLKRSYRSYASRHILLPTANELTF